ncbi:MAG: thiamine-phosphate kinase, partial [Alphaproteobacteria bacterium]
LSDLAAKGATPLFYLLAAAFPAPFDRAWITAFASGLAADQAEFGISLSGGDTIRVATGASGPVIAITAIGTVPTGTMVRRTGGQPGDHLFVSGEIGGAAAGLACLPGEPSPFGDLSGAARAAAIGRYRLPLPRCGLANAVRAHAAAAIDVSDGLVGDCDKLAAASGCSAIIDANTVPLHGSFSGKTGSADVIAAAIAGGDDFEILAAIPPGQIAPFTAAAADVGIGVTDIGMLRKADHSPAPASPTSVLLDNQPLQLPRRSYVHSRTGDDERAGDSNPDGN